MKKSIFLLAFLLSMLWNVSAVAEKCDWPVCFGIDWRTATLADVQGINVRARDQNGNTPLHFAAGQNENPDIINALIQAGADIHARTKNGYVPLHGAAENNKNPDIITALIQAGADINAKSKDGFTPLHWAAVLNQQEAVLLLLENGADATISNGEGLTPLDLVNNPFLNSPLTVNAEEFRNSEAYWALNDASYAPAGAN